MPSSSNGGSAEGGGGAGNADEGGGLCGPGGSGIPQTAAPRIAAIDAAGSAHGAEETAPRGATDHGPSAATAPGQGLLLPDGPAQSFAPLIGVTTTGVAPDDAGEDWEYPICLSGDVDTRVFVRCDHIE